MYSPAEINKAYKLKTSIIYMVPCLGLVVLLLYYPPRIVLALTGTVQGVKFHEISDSLQQAKVKLQNCELKLQRQTEISVKFQQQLENCKNGQQAISVVSGSGTTIQMDKPQFESWTDWSTSHAGKKFSDFREAEVVYYKAEIERIWAELKKGGSHE